MYDYVIVGGGSAGCVLAGKLSEDPNHSVCLLEAGPANNDLRVKVPIGLVSLMNHPTYDWRFRSEPHAHLNDRVVSIPRGRLLGGSGSINSMVYIRGRASDYDGWENSGCDGWGWHSVLPIFCDQERNGRLPTSELHGDEGPLHVEDLPSPHSMISNWLKAGAALGIPANPDFNGATQEGFGNYQVTMHRGRRWSSADAYIAPARQRKNLQVITNFQVDRFDLENGRAQRVYGHSSDQEQEIEVGGELILAAGAIGSPAILMRSGIGPSAHLSALGIDVRINRPGVGQNLHDHPAIGVHYGGGTQGYALSFATLFENLRAPIQYLVSRSGLCASNTVEGGGFARTSSELDEPDVQFHFIPARVGHEGKMIVGGRGYYSDVCLLKPKSRGRLTLRSSSALDPPAIDLNLLSDNRDKEKMLAGVKLLRAVLAQPALSEGASELVPGHGVQSDEELLEFIQDRLGTAYHPVGTCRMGHPDDLHSVVDTRLKVIDTENVRVTDASIMPEIIAGNTNAPTMMIAERAAKIIRADA